MKKSDLKTGYLVELKNGGICFVVNDLTTVTKGKQFCLIDSEFNYVDDCYNEDMFDVISDNFTINKVYEPFSIITLLEFDIKNSKLLWQRKEDKLDIINDIVDELCERYKVKARQVYYELPNFGKAVIKLTLENDYLINIDIDKQLLEAIEEKEIKLRINTMFVEEFCRLALKEVEK